jgi:hypothetical protein
MVVNARAYKKEQSTYKEIESALESCVSRLSGLQSDENEMQFASRLLVDLRAVLTHVRMARKMMIEPNTNKDE